MSFHENLRYYRKRAGYTTKQISDLLGIASNTYAGYEIRGREPKYQTLCKIADLLNVSTDELLGREKNTLGKINVLPLLPTKFELTPLEQLKVAAGEMVEAANACFIYSNRRHFLEELCDVQVAIETLKYHNFTEEEIAAMHKFVNRKNKKRRYL